MPLYEYECQSCHRRIEKRQKFSDPELTICPHCSGALERTITAPAFQFAGGGWYKDGYGSAKPTASGESGASGSETSGSKTGDSASGSSSGEVKSVAAAEASSGGEAGTTSGAASAPAAAGSGASSAQASAGSPAASKS